MKVEIREELCPKNHYCPVTRICPQNAILQESPYQAPEIDENNCSDCGLCTNYCAYGAIAVSTN